MQAYQLKIKLDRIEPSIWRTVLVPADITLDVLHDVIQASMGWFNGHLHEFVVGKQAYGPSDSDLPSQVRDETGVSLVALIRKKGDTLRYLYDYGDSWMHTISLEKILAEVDVDIPRCIDGKRACPPEDCGGSSGYQGILQALQDPEDADSEEQLEWLGEAFDPEYFDVDAVNAMLAHFVVKPKKTAAGRKKTAPVDATVANIDENKIDDAVLALLSLTFHGDAVGTRAWKNFDWEALDRLHANGYIHDPVGKAKSVVMTKDGKARALKLFAQLFSK